MRSRRRVWPLLVVSGQLLGGVAVAACATGQVLDDTAFGDGGGSGDGASLDAGRDAKGGGNDSGRHDATMSMDASDAAQESGDDAGMEAGDDGGSDAGMDVGVEAGMDAGMDAPFESGVIDGGPLTRYGNVAPFASNSSHGPNYLLGSPLAIPVNCTLVAFGVIARSSGPQAIMALYTDSGGQPGNLVAQTAAFTLNNQTMEISAPNVAITAGNYWIMGIYNVTASIGIDYSNASAQVDYISLNFGAQLPSPFPSPTTYTGQQFNYYVIVQ